MFNAALVQVVKSNSYLRLNWDLLLNSMVNYSQVNISRYRLDSASVFLFKVSIENSGITWLCIQRVLWVSISVGLEKTPFLKLWSWPWEMKLLPDGLRI